MNHLENINPSELTENVIELIGKEWMLVSAGDSESFNTMTASWGSIGYYSNQPIATIFIRPERYTFDFIEQSDYFTLSFLPANYRQALALLGKVSGRDCDKVAQAGLTPIFTEIGNPTFKEARLVLECRKIYGQMMNEESFTDHSIYEKWYGESHGNLHKLYMAAIEKCWIER